MTAETPLYDASLPDSYESWVDRLTAKSALARQQGQYVIRVETQDVIALMRSAEPERFTRLLEQRRLETARQIAELRLITQFVER